MLIKKPFKKGLTTGAGTYQAAGGGGGLDTSTTAWINAVVAAGGSVSGGQQTNVDTLIKAYKSAGVFSLLDREWLYASESAIQAKIDIVNLAVHTVNGTPTFTASQGYQSVIAGADYIDTGYQSGTNFTLNGNSFGAYVRTSRTAGAADTATGSNGTGGDITFFQALTGSNTTLFDSNGASFPSNANGNAQGNYLFSRTSSSLVTAYKNTTAFTGQTSNTFGTVPAFNFFVFGNNNGGSINGSSTDQIAAVFYGGAMNGTQAAAKNAALNAYMTSLGTNVY